MAEMNTADAEMMQSLISHKFKGPHIVRFYRDVVLNDRETNGWTESKFSVETGKEFTIFHPGKGRNVFEETDWVEIRSPGNGDEIRVRPVRYGVGDPDRPGDDERFAAQWAAYKKGLGDAQIGTPLALVPGISKPEVIGYASSGITTAENLVACSDVDGQKFMAFSAAKMKAKAFLDRQKAAEPGAKLESELKLRDAEIAGQQAMIDEMKQQIAALMKKK